MFTSLKYSILLIINSFLIKILLQILFFISVFISDFSDLLVIISYNIFSHCSSCDTKNDLMMMNKSENMHEMIV